ncbi:MAG: hypothetical protein V3S98_02465, partial [Dehalococcoidia bacterium]
TMAVTVMEEVDADKMMAEMVRVTKPGGRVAVIVRAVDQPWIAVIPVSDVILSQATAPGGQVAPTGCADVSLYSRFRARGLTDLKLFPTWATSVSFDGADADRAIAAMGRKVALEYRQEFADAAERAVADGTFLASQPFHCAVGTKAN